MPAQRGHLPIISCKRKLSLDSSDVSSIQLEIPLVGDSIQKLFDQFTVERIKFLRQLLVTLPKSTLYKIQNYMKMADRTKYTYKIDN